MNYSNSIRKTTIGKRILISWLIVAVAFSLIGGVIGGMIGYSNGKKAVKTETSNGEPKEEIKVYGTYDGKTFKDEEMSMDWGMGDLNFVPLDIPLDAELQEFIFHLSNAYNIDYTLVLAIIDKESEYKISAVGDGGNSYGLMQINNVNAAMLEEKLGITDLLDPYQNIRSGLFILRDLFGEYDSTEKVLMAYNMGRRGASRLWEQGIYETNYTRAVLRIQRSLNEEKGGDVH